MTEKQETERAYYIGKRMVKGMPRHCFVRTDGGFVHYPRAKDHMFYGCVIGRLYEWEDSMPKLWNDALAVGCPPHENAEAWQADHRLAIEQNKAKKMKATPEIDRHIDALRDAVNQMSMAERSRFLAYLINQFMSWRR